MKKEYDLNNELGYKNWIDAVAGEAVVIGYTLHEPELEILGTKLARLVLEIRFDSDSFSKVVGAAMYLSKRIEQVKKEQLKTIVVEEVFQDGKERDAYRWQYGLVYAEGKYQIKMILVVYDKYTLENTEAIKFRKVVRNEIGDPSFESLIRKKIELDYAPQKYRVTTFEKEGEGIVCKIVDHDHEDCWSKGWFEVYYFDDFLSAKNAWESAKKQLRK